MIGQQVFGRDFRLDEGGVGEVAIADLPIEDMVVMLARPMRAFGLVLDVLAQQRRVGVHRLERIDQNRQRFVFDLDEIGGVGRDIAVGGDDEGDFLILEQHLAVGEHHLHVAGQRRHPGEIDALEILGRQHGDDAGHGLGLGRVDLDDARMRMAGAVEIAVQHAGQFDVVDIIAAALGEAHVFDALALAAHALKFLGAFERSGSGGSVHSAASLNSTPLIFAAAYWMALTMFW